MNVSCCIGGDDEADERICEDDKMVNITDVRQILQFAIDAEIKVFLDGGWGVDALLGF